MAGVHVEAVRIKMTQDPLDALARQARACRLCEADMGHEPRPVFRLSATARLLIIGQAPGTRVHDSGIPWDDRSGDRLRDWLGLSRQTFYDENRIAILPMGLCFPGLDAKGGDRPPLPRCAPTWHPRFLPLMPQIALTLLVGGYAQKRYLSTQSLGETVAAFERFLPRFLPLPHPSWRNTGWLKKNPWFEKKLLPVLRDQVAQLL
jgi:uracil-DNA glycosylase